MRELIAVRSLSLCLRPGVVGEGEKFSLPDGPELDSVLKLGYARFADVEVPTPVAEVEPAATLAPPPPPEVEPTPLVDKRRGLVINRR